MSLRSKASAIVLAIGIAAATSACGGYVVVDTPPRHVVTDTDGDGLLDVDERAYGTFVDDPDSDADGLSDGHEVFDVYTDPLDPDTDVDGLYDGEEIYDWATDPLSYDTDEDGLSDYDEVLVYYTDPTNWDSDFDGVSDRTELREGTDPLVAYR